MVSHVNGWQGIVGGAFAPIFSWLHGEKGRYWDRRFCKGDWGRQAHLWGEDVLQRLWKGVVLPPIVLGDDDQRDCCFFPGVLGLRRNQSQSLNQPKEKGYPTPWSKLSDQAGVKDLPSTTAEPRCVSQLYC